MGVQSNPGFSHRSFSDAKKPPLLTTSARSLSRPNKNPVTIASMRFPDSATGFKTTNLEDGSEGLARARRWSSMYRWNACGDVGQSRQTPNPRKTWTGRARTWAAAWFSFLCQNSFSKNCSPGLKLGERRCKIVARRRWRGRGVMSHGCDGTEPTNGTTPFSSGSALGYLMQSTHGTCIALSVVPNDGHSRPGPMAQPTTYEGLGAAMPRSRRRCCSSGLASAAGSGAAGVGGGVAGS